MSLSTNLVLISCASLKYKFDLLKLDGYTYAVDLTNDYCVKQYFHIDRFGSIKHEDPIKECVEDKEILRCFDNRIWSKMTGFIKTAYSQYGSF